MPRLDARAGLAPLALIAVALAALVPAGARADSSGADASGYVWVDNQGSSPVVAFDWIDATGGTPSDISDRDDKAQMVTLPFPFVFFNTEYTALEVSTNGFLSFDVGSDCNDNYNWDDRQFEDSGNPIPFTDVDCDEDSGWGGNPLIAAFFDDLDAGNCGDIYYDTLGEEPDRVFAVEYNDVCHNQCKECGPGDGITFEVLLFEGSNDIKVQYKDTFFSEMNEVIAAQNGGATATTGIGNDETVGLGYSWREPLPDGLAVLYTSGAANLAIAKTASDSEVAVGDTVTFAIEVSNKGLTDATGVTVRDELADGLAYVSALTSRGECAKENRTVTCDLGDLAAGESAAIDLVVRVTAPGTISNTASVSGSETASGVEATATAVVDAVAPAQGASGGIGSADPADTAVLAALPDTGGRPDRDYGVTRLAMTAAVLAAIGLGGLWTVLRGRVR